MSAIGGKADVVRVRDLCLLMTQSGHHPSCAKLSIARFRCDCRSMAHLAAELPNSSLSELETGRVKKLCNCELAIGRSLLVGISEQRL